MTPHVLDQLPLWVEGDLDASGLAAVERHLAQCPDCAHAAGDLRASQGWLREAMASPFEATDREPLRRQVMARVRVEVTPKPAHRLIPRSALLAACAASLLLAVLLWRQDIPVERRQPSVDPKATPQPSQPVTRTATIPRELPQTITRGRPAPSREAPPPAGPARIEFQTADRTIRIIWLTQAKSLPETHPSPEEKS